MTGGVKRLRFATYLDVLFTNSLIRHRESSATALRTGYGNLMAEQFPAQVGARHKHTKQRRAPATDALNH